jgi:hypothetical protein
LGTLDVAITRPNGDLLATATLTARRSTTIPPPSSANFDISCTPSPVVTSLGAAPVEVTCDFSGMPSLGERSVTLTGLAMNAPTGWLVAASAGDPGAGSLTMAPGATVSLSTPYTFSMFVTPGGCGTQPGLIDVTSALSFAGTAGITGPIANVAVGLTPGGSVLPGISATGLDFGTSEWTGTAYTPATAGLTLTIIEPSGISCGNWTIQVSTNGVYHETTREQIPAGAFTYLGSQSTQNLPANLTPVESDLALSPAGITIASGGETTAAGSWNVQFALIPPNEASPGAYSGTVTFSVVNAA